MNEGDICYSDNGQELQYITHVAGGHIVLPIYESEDEFENCSEYTGEPFVIRIVYTKPPVEKKLQAIAKLDAELSEKRKQLAVISEELRNFNTDEKSRIQRIKQHDGLELLDLWLQDKITHFVMAPEYGQISVVTKEQALKKDDKYDRDIKLLSLYGASKGDLKFGVNRYSDGSGSHVYAYPFSSESDAAQYAEQLIKSKFTEALKDIKVNVRDYDELIKNAEALKVVVPEELIDNRLRITRSRNILRIQKLEEELDKLKNESSSC